MAKTTSVIYKMYNPSKDSYFLSAYCNEKKYELIEEIEVPDGEDPEEYAQQLMSEVDLGDMCEQRTKY
jgi:hypothetical protein